MFHEHCGNPVRTAPLVLNVTEMGWICIGQQATLNAIATGGTSGYVYQWSNGSPGATVVVAPTVSAVYTVSVTDVNGCTTNPELISLNVYPGLMAATAGMIPFALEDQQISR
ncbi:MAG: hypothetical protein IPJ66_17510 [Bacteroidetes bacterium]|nr:hypothetical protein [Bacteroidota bacterium]